MDLQRSEITFQAAVSKEDGSTLIEGWGEVWGVVNRAQRVFVPGAFKKSIRGISQSRRLPMGYQHEDVVGGWHSVQEKSEGGPGGKGGLFLKGSIPDTGPGTLEYRASVHAHEGNLGVLSIGFDAQEVVYAAPGEKKQFVTPYGPIDYRFQEYTSYIVTAELVETSLVIAGISRLAKVTAVQSLDKAMKALPVLQHLEEPTWEDAAYSMALIMGGRGAAAFVDLPDDDHFDLYRQVASAYQVLDRTPPAYVREPEYAEIEFQHDERVVFADRYLRKNLATAVAGARGLQGPLSEETRQQAREALDVLGPLTEAPSSELAGELTSLADQLRSSIQGDQT